MDEISALLKKHQNEFHHVVDHSPKDNFFHFDFTRNNTVLQEADIADTEKFSAYIDTTLQHNGAKYGIGGYNEDRVLYRSSNLFDGIHPRTIHLGIDIWGAAGTKVYAPLGGVVHSFAFNNDHRDYGATIILQHQLETKVFYTLYGHLSLDDLSQLKEGKFIIRGDTIGHFGKPVENGNWPPHLHFQVIRDMRIHKGDYPGVCNILEREKYILNCPDPDLILQMMKYAG
jgi:murein DD-endopeptidase MepM/ murein hydrolase activator NlpD